MPHAIFFSLALILHVAVATAFASSVLDLYKQVNTLISKTRRSKYYTYVPCVIIT